MPKKRKTSYGDPYSALTEVLSDREKEVVGALEAKLRKDQESFDVDRSAAYCETSPSDVLHLNIGGSKTTVLRRTLTSVPGSMLASRFSGRWDDSIERDKDGDIFIDQEFSIFEPMINYLRNKANGNETYPIRSPFISGRTPDFYRMVEYYGMTDGIFPIKLTNYAGSEDSAATHVSKIVNTKEWTTFRLLLDGHSRSIKTYEVTLGDVQRIQIGWEYGIEDGELTSGNSLGVGDVDNTFALDLTRHSYLVVGESTTIDNIEHPKGTVVRSEDYGKNWYVDGEVVAPTSEETWYERYEDYGYAIYPLISIKGEMEITSVEFQD